MPKADPVVAVQRFNEAIDRRDADALRRLMTGDHAFVDSDGTEVRGRVECLALWRRFFDGFPDYENVFEEVTADDDVVTVAGHSICSDGRLEGPALWRALVSDGKLAEWRVYEDTPETRRELGLPER